MHTQDDMYTSTTASHYHNYKGFLKRSIYKNYRDNCFRFFDYLYTMSSSHVHVINFMRTLHYVQLFILSLCPQNKIFWPPHSILGKIINIVSIIGNLCTSRSTELTHITIAFIIYSIVTLLTIFLFFNVIIFHKYTKVNQNVINFFCVYLNAFIPYLILYIGSNIGREISVICKYYFNSILYVPESDYEIKLQIACFSIGIILEVVLFVVQLLFVTPVLSFRLQSIHFLSSKAMLCYIGSYFVISVFLSVASCMNNYIILFLCIIPIILLHILTYSYVDVWGTYQFQISSLSILETISILLFLECIFLIFKIRINEILLLLSVILFFALKYICSIVDVQKRQKFLTLCTMILNDPQIFEQLTENNVLLLLRIGFEMGHKLCHDWTAFEYAEKLFPKNRRILLLTIRYSALYPEEKLLFRVVINKVRRAKKGDIEMKYLLFQMNSLFRQRERGLTKSLKKVLSHIDNKTDKCRNQIRVIWTSVMQRNLSEIENLTFELKKNADEITREYNQLYISYPNNPYVASAYGAFLSDIWCKEKESSSFKRIYRLLRNGGKTRVEKSFYFAKLLFHNLPTEDMHNEIKKNEDDEFNNNEFTLKKNRNNNALNNSIVSMSVDNFYNEMNEEANAEKAQKKYLETMVETIRLSSLRFGPFLIFASISIVFPICSIILAVLISGKMEANVSAVKLIEKESLQMAVVSQISIAFYYYVLNSNRLATSFYDMLSLKTTSLDHLISLVMYDEDLLDDINGIFPSLFKTGFFNDSLNFLFNDSIHSNRAFTNYSSGMATHSYEFFITLVSEAVLRAAPMKAIKLLNMTDFWSLVYSYPYFLNEIVDFSDVQLTEVDKMIRRNYITCLKMVFTLGALVGFIFLAITVFAFKKMNIEKMALFMSLKSLPKSAISATIAKINEQLGKHDDQQNQTFFSTQEERALNYLNMDKNRSISKISDRFFIADLVVFIISVSLCLFCLARSQKVIVDKLPRLCSVLFSVSSVHSTLAAIILSQSRIAAYNQKQIPFNSLQDKSELINMTVVLFKKLSQQIHNMRIGGDVNHANSLGLFGLKTDYFTSVLDETENCTIIDDYQILINCISLENSMAYVHLTLNSLINQIIQNPDYQIPLNHEALENSIRWLFNVSFPSMVQKTMEMSVNSATSLHNQIKIILIIVPLVIFNGVIILCGVALIPRFVKSGEAAKWAMRLLLFCPPSVVLHSRPIIKVLSNDFSVDDGDDQDKGHFYEKVVGRINEAAIFLDNEFTVHSTNVQFERLFGNDKIGTNLIDLFDSPPDNESSLLSFKQKLSEVKLMKRAPTFEGEITVLANDTEDDENEKVTPKLFHFLLIGIDLNGLIQKKPILSDGISVFSLTLNDLTKTADQEAKLVEEKAKKNKILNEVLPQKVMNKINGNFDTKVCFDVNTASFVIIHFVSTQRLMVNISPSSFLLAFKSIMAKMDELAKSFRGLTKLPSLSDSYVVACGLFDNEGGEKAHIRSAINFAIKAISTFKELIGSNRDSLLNGLRLTVGTSSGGPVVAGIVNLTAPTFSVVGWPLSLAVELDRKCKLMNIHLPRSMYEIAYGKEDETEKRSFHMEEFAIEFDGKNIDTYFLSP